MKGNLMVSLNGVRSFVPDMKVFNGGEVNVSIPEQAFPVDVGSVLIQAQIMDSEMLMALLFLVDALRRRFPEIQTIDLELPYVPYARQDRVCNRGESLTSGVFCNMINSCNFNQVAIIDPHSDVVSALIDNVRVIDVPSVLLQHKELSTALFSKELLLVAPDYGSTKKVEKVAQRFKHDTIIQGTKTRDLKTGALSGFGFYGDVKGRNLLVVDDICDGGGTFIGLAEKLKEAGANEIALYVTHGIFSRGYKYLLDKGIDKLYTTNSLEQDFEATNLVDIIKVI